MNYSVLKKRYIGLDIFRIISFIAVCAFHTTIHLGADYGWLNSVSMMGAVFMTAFFMLSGYSLFVNYSQNNLIEITNAKTFYIKRILGIIPMYYVVAILFIVFYTYTGNTSFKIELLLGPIEILGLQSVFSSLFGFSHNGGTWFISCILLCYIVYPLIQEILKQISDKSKFLVIFISVFILLYSPLVVSFVKISGIYSNPFFRILEFLIGCTLAALKFKFDQFNFVSKYFYKWVSVLILYSIMWAGISLAVKFEIGVGNYMLYSWICLPIFMLLIICMSGVNCVCLSNSKLIKYLCSVSYVFFLAQLFSNAVGKFVINKFLIKDNIAIIFVGWGGGLYALL